MCQQGSSMNPPKVTFIGFGEVASVFSSAIYEQSEEVRAYDVLLDTKDGIERLRKRSRAKTPYSTARYQPRSAQLSLLVIREAPWRTGQWTEVPAAPVAL